MKDNSLPIKLNLPQVFFEEEVRSGYLVSAKMKKIWAVELDLLNELLNVCNKYGLSIYANGGTILGAVRHKGMIPWDDDIDMMMPRKDYEKLCSIALSEFKYPYFFQTEDTDPGSYRGHAQFRNSKTTAILESEYVYKRKMNQGIFIDIFPLDNVPDSIEDREKFKNQAQKMRRKYNEYLLLSLPYHFVFRKNLVLLGLSIVKRLLIPHHKVSRMCKVFYNRFVVFTKKYIDIPTKSFLCIPFCTTIYDKNDLAQPIYMPFEILSIPVPFNYEKILEELYGDWHEFIIAPSMHGKVIFDTEKSYIEYLK